MTILEPYASLAYRTIKLALSARRSSFGARPVIASSDHLKLLDHQRRSRVEAAYVWAVMDGFFLATPTFEKYDSQGAFKAITHIFVVGDLDGLDRLRARLGRPLELLLDAAVCDPLVERLAHAGSWARLKFGLLPSSVYAINDRVKALRQGLIVHETVKPLGPLLFAGNDGIEPVRQMLATCLEQTLDTSEIEVINSAFAKVRMSGAQPSSSDSALACQICAAFDALIQFARSSIARSRNAHFPFDEHGISTIVYKALFRHAVLDRLRHLRLVETIYPPRNVSVYTRSRFNSRRMLDFGSTNGFEVLYPRTLDCRLYGKTIVSCNDACKSAFLHGRPDAQALERMLTGVFAAAKAAVSPQPN